jgi:tetratricopeptide (TPR) repeat protein
MDNLGATIPIDPSTQRIGMKLAEYKAVNLRSNPNKPMALSLEPIEGEPQHAQNAAPAPGKEPGLPAPEKKLLDQAEQEFDNGSLNQVLWQRVLAKAGGDKTAAKTAYLRARARELELLKQTGGSAGAVVISREAARPEATRPTPGKPSSDKADDAAADARSRRPFLIAAIATIAVIAIAVGGWAAMRRDSAQSAQPAVAAASAQKPRPAAEEGAPAEKAIPREDFAARCKELIAAGNWNMLVIYASEWTRKEPANAAAWTQLSIGYTKLRQLNDAFQAATKAVNLGPQDPLAWRNLGQLHLALKEPIPALAAFEQAAALDDKDADSFSQAGKLNLQLERMPQAKIAFDHALAANPDNVDALCGEMTLAQKQGRARDAEEMAGRLAALAGTCQYSTDQGATVVVKRPVSEKTPRPAGR